MSSSSNIKSTIPFLMVSDMDTSLQFYVDGLGFEIEARWTPAGKIEWCQIRRGEGVLMLQVNRKKIPTAKKGISVYFICRDSLEIYDELAGNGLSPSEPFVSNGMWLTSILDPDGYEINFESDTTVPEATLLSEWKKEQH